MKIHLMAVLILFLGFGCNTPNLEPDLGDVYFSWDTAIHDTGTDSEAETDTGAEDLAESDGEVQADVHIPEAAPQFPLINLQIQAESTLADANLKKTVVFSRDVNYLTIFAGMIQSIGANSQLMFQSLKTPVSISGVINLDQSYNYSGAGVLSYSDPAWTALIHITIGELYTLKAYISFEGEGIASRGEAKMQLLSGTTRKTYLSWDLTSESNEFLRFYSIDTEMKGLKFNTINSERTVNQITVSEYESAAYFQYVDASKTLQEKHAFCKKAGDTEDFFVQLQKTSSQGSAPTTYQFSLRYYDFQAAETPFYNQSKFSPDPYLTENWFGANSITMADFRQILGELLPTDPPVDSSTDWILDTYNEPGVSEPGFLDANTVQNPVDIYDQKVADPWGESIIYPQL